ncbi:hypothetical protein HWB90_gp087 [Mycobacterium phage Fowlmouth]|uniref:Uncharacterized protein n=2 Tax=Fowlmouthvirus fowlmouth TaxID=2845652 RepID=A0A7G8LPZ2_9CAUD|nr:hypothetical protein HWB90_gp087 [Mycobacterium phage Fowlmouth]AYN58052.1 hypothetical protein SEA_FOWLMOUTH_103 [Mycobacterium phage Fowlmouth]QNJ59314.1 hypothetical protein SEA_MRMIYAGI_101 [Mycobacterium phage MrMiyagi]
MTQPMDPNDYPDDSSEYGWGPGIFPPGIADNEGQRLKQDDFGANLPYQTEPIGDARDNYARAVADRRTDSTDPTSGRDFESLGNPDRFGAQPPLVQGQPEANKSQNPKVERNKLRRKR